MKDNNLIVMIDDDEDDHEFFEIALSEINKPVKCLYFPDFKHAIEHFSKDDANAPRLVFIDINLPSVSGPECLIELQKLSEFDHPCIVIHSATIPVEWQPGLKAIGVDKFVEKSSSIPLLAEKLQQLLA